MPKMKTKSGAKKRFKVTGNGRVKFKQAKSRHMQMNKPKKMKRKARGTDIMFIGDENLVLRYAMPYEQKKLRRRKPARKSANTNSQKSDKGAA
jgi:large subunit ribosomal protein L35